MPVVPFTSRDAMSPAPQPKVPDVYLMMAAADLHEAGRLFEPSIKGGGTDQFSTDAETLDEMDAHIPPESKPRPVPGPLYDKPPKDVG